MAIDMTNSCVSERREVREKKKENYKKRKLREESNSESMKQNHRRKRVCEKRRKEGLRLSITGSGKKQIDFSHNGVRL
jgi:hypothetical protein